MEINTVTNCFWITGLSSAGKSTLSEILANKLKSEGKPVVLLDGDELREIFSNKDYGKNDRFETALKYSKLCSLIVSQKVNVVIAVIGLFNMIHQWNRKNIPGYVEIFIDVPMEELTRRDPKQIYKKAIAGQIKNVFGVDLKAEYPENPDVILKWSPGKSVEGTMEELFKKIF